MPATADGLPSGPSFHLLDLVQGGGDSVWGILEADQEDGINSDENVRPWLGTFDASAGTWRPIGMPELSPACKAVKLAAFKNGEVVCLWQSGEDWVLTRHSPDGGNTLWCAFGELLNQPRLLPLSTGGLIITEQGPKIVSVPHDEKAAATSVVPDAFWRQDKEEQSYSRIQGVEGGDGTVWLWSPRMENQMWVRHLDGFVRWTGKAEVISERKPFKSGSPVSVAAPDGAEHLLVAVAGEGLFRVRLKDASAEQLPGPGNAFDYIAKIAVVGGRTHVVTCPRPDRSDVEGIPAQNALIISTTHFYNTSKPVGALWRWEPERAAFEKLLDGLDSMAPFAWYERPLIATRAGLLVGSADHGPWWIPGGHGGRAFVLDAGQGFNLRSTADLAVVSGGLVIGRGDDSTWALRLMPGRHPVAVETRVTTLSSGSRLVQDSRQHLWTFGVEGKAFAEWDGRSWQERPLPEAVKALSVEEMTFVADHHNQAWLLTGDAGKTAIFDLKPGGGWRVFDTLAAAVEEGLVAGDHLPYPDFRWIIGPMSHARGGKAFYDLHGTAHVLTEGRWSSITLADLAGPEAKIYAKPFFNKTGAFCLRADAREYRCLPTGQWLEFPPSEEESEELWSYEGKPREPEGGWEIPKVEAAALDRFGVIWLFLQDGGLRKMLGGKRIAVTDHDRPLTLPPGRPIEDVLIDPEGNAFLTTAGPSEFFRHLVVKSPRSASVEVSPPALNSPEAGLVSVKVSGPAGALCRWRVDGKQWQPVTELPAESLSLPGLTPGRHRLELQMFDSELTGIGGLQTLNFTVQSLPEAVMDEQIRALQSGDLDRCEAAAGMLRSQGEAGLPAIKRALDDPGTDETRRWWLRAILQQVEKRP